MGDALLNEVLEANQTTATENKRLKEDIQEIKSEKSFLEKTNEELQATLDDLKKENEEINKHALIAIRLLTRNLNDAKQKLYNEKQENEVLQANKEILKGIISDLKGEILEEKMEKNQMEKDFTSTKETYSEPFVMEFKSICSSQPVVSLSTPSFNPFHDSGYLDNYRDTTRC